MATQHPRNLNFLHSIDEHVECHAYDCAVELSASPTRPSKRLIIKKHFAKLKTCIGREVGQNARQSTKDNTLALVADHVLFWVERFLCLACEGDDFHHLNNCWRAPAWLASVTIGSRLLDNERATGPETDRILRRFCHDLIQVIDLHLLRAAENECNDLDGSLHESKLIATAPEPEPIQAPKPEDSWAGDLGERAYRYDEDLRRLAKFCRGRIQSENELREQFPTLCIWQAIDESDVLRPQARESFFWTSLSAYRQPERFDFIGGIMGASWATAYDWYLDYRDRAGLKRKRRRSPRTASAETPHS